MNWRAILEKQNTTEQKNKKNQNNTQSNISDISYISSVRENKKSFQERLETIREEALYRYNERLGISNNPDLAIQEVLSYMIDFIKQEFNHNNNEGDSQ